MDLSSDLRELRRELDTLRSERDRQATIDEAERQERIAQVQSLFQSLGVEGTLSEMNRVLLDGRGEVEVYAPWIPQENGGDEDEEDLEEDEETEEDNDSVSAILTWDEEGTREVAVDMGMTSNGMYVQVNGNDTRLDKDALNRALIRAFREELGM